MVQQIQTDTITNKPYWQALGMTYDPFTDHKEVYHNTSQRENQLELLQHLLQFSHVIKVIYGGEGVGKSTYIKYLQHKLDSITDLILINAESNLTSSQLLQHLNQHFGLAQSLVKKDGDFKYLIDRLQKNNKPTTVIIDDAHQLNDHTLTAILNSIKYNTAEDPKLHFLLVGDKSLPSKLQALLQNERYEDYIHQLELQPYDFEQTCHFIEQRLNQAGLKDNPLSKSELRIIHKNSEGRIALINQYTQEALKRKAGSKSSFSFIEEYRNKLLGGAIILVILSIVLYQSNTPTPIDVVTASLPLPQDKHPIVNTNDIEDVGFEDNYRPKEETLSEHSQTFESDSLATIDLNRQASTTSQEKNTKVVDNTEDNTVNSALPSTESNKALAESSTTSTSKMTDEEFENKHSIKPVSAFKEGTSLDKLKTEINTSDLPTQTVTTKEAVSQVEKTYSRITRHSNKEQLNKAAGKKSSNNTSHKKSSDDEILNTQSNYYTIQLIGSSNMNELKKFVETHQLQKDTKYHKIKRNGKDWFVVLYGKYPTREEAQRALNKMPSDVRKLKPWLRTYGSLHDLAHVRKTT